MLINEPLVLNNSNLLLTILSSLEDGEQKQLDTGIYEVNHYGCSPFIDGYTDYYTDENKELVDRKGDWFCNYGVCDNYQQILEQCPMLKESNRQFFITVKSVKKNEQSEIGGWRWHKWGPYIGTQEITTEYLYNEPIIEEVFVYHIYEKEN